MAGLAPLQGRRFQKLVKLPMRGMTQPRQSHFRVLQPGSEPVNEVTLQIYALGRLNLLTWALQKSLGGMNCLARRERSFLSLKSIEHERQPIHRFGIGKP
jgi:hypothetical protein